MRAPVIATLVMLRDGDYVLLGLKKNAEIGTGKINAAGGKWKENENILQCAAREVKEEFDIDIRTKDLRHIANIECYAGTEFFQRVHVYLATSFSGVPRETSSMTPVRYRLDELPYMRMHGGDRFWFRQAAEGKRFRAKIWYRLPGEGYIRHELSEY